MKNIFKNVELQKEFEINGYVILPILNLKEVEILNSFFFEINLSGSNTFFSSIFSSDSNLKKKTDEGIKQVIAEKIDNVLNNYKLVVANFVVKFPGENSIVHPHQDWSFVDEDLYTSLNFWIPLTQTDINSGSLHVYPGSHKWPKTYRGTNIELALDRIFSVLTKQMLELKVPIGNAVVYDHRLIHGSPSNMSKKPRIAAAVTVIPQIAELIHFEKKNDELRKFSIDTDFFYDYTYVSQHGNIIPDRYVVKQVKPFTQVSFEMNLLNSSNKILPKLINFLEKIINRN